MSQVASSVVETIAAPKTVKPQQKKGAQKKAAPKVKAVKEAPKGKTIKVTKTTSKGKGQTAPKAKCFYLTDEQIAAFRAEYKETKVIPIPHNSGLYRTFLNALLTLGKDKPHSFKAVKEEMRSVMSAPDTKVEGKTQWQRFIGKEASTEVEENAFNIDEKLHLNAEVLQRLGGNTPYGMKILQVGQKVLKTKGMVVDILKGKDGKERLYRLNTNAADPTNEFRRARSK